MQRYAARVLREVYRREALPARVRWWMVASGMRDWLRLVARGLRDDIGRDEARAVSAELAAETFRRRYDVLRASWPHLRDDPEQRRNTMAALYRMTPRTRGGYLFDAMGGLPRGSQWLAAHRAIAPLSAEQRWEELTVHLGEWLIVVTETLPERYPRARKQIADVCFDAGRHYGEAVKRLLRIEDDGDPAARAIEVLRVSEYLFRVNPHHWGETDPASRTGYLEGNACPWYSRPGWERGHCGIFGQFQAGVCSVFGLRYQLTKTIPKHGGHTCRVDLKPIELRLSRAS